MRRTNSLPLTLQVSDKNVPRAIENEARSKTPNRPWPAGGVNSVGTMPDGRPLKTYNGDRFPYAPPVFVEEQAPGVHALVSRDGR